MYKEEEYRAFLAKRDMSPEKIQQYVEAVEKAEKYFNAKNKKITEGKVEDFREYVAHLIEQNENTYDDLMPLGRYVYMLDMKEPWIYYAAILGGESIMPSIRERLTELAGDDVCNTVFSKAVSYTHLRAHET